MTTLLLWKTFTSIAVLLVMNIHLLESRQLIYFSENTNNTFEIDVPVVKNDTSEIDVPVVKNDTSEIHVPVLKNDTSEIHVPEIKNDTSEIHVPVIKNNSSCKKYKIRIAVLEIANNEIDLALNIFQELQETDNYETLHTIIEDTYARNTENLPKLLKFINKLPQCSNRFTGFEILFHSIHFNNTWASFQFAYQLKKFFDEAHNCSDVNDDTDLKEKLVYLKNKLPKGIRTIIWQQSKLCLKNAHNKEYLYVASCCNFDASRRRVFSWIPKNDIGYQNEFTFEPIKDGSLFRIKSDYNEEYLYAAECCKYDSERRNVFTWIPKSDIGIQGEWTLELVNESNLFRIRNDHYNEYLYAAECCFFDEERRSIFTWVPKGDIGIQGEWNISPCNSI